MSSFQEEKIQLADRFEVTGYSYKPFYKLTQEENKALGAKNNKNIIFFKATLIKADEPSTHRAIISGEYVRKNRDKWTGIDITMGHPDFKKGVNMKERPEADIVRDIIAYQKQFAVGKIMKVDDHPTDQRLQNFYGYIDNPSLVKGIQNGETLLPRYGSPYFWHLGDIDRSSFDKDGNFLVNEHAPVHWAFVKSPAMGQEIEVHSFCTGEEMSCLQKMQANSTIGEDTEWGARIESNSKQGVSVVYSCPARFIEDRFEDGLDKSFYVEDPLSSLKMSSNSETTQTTTDPKSNKEVNDFMSGGKPQGSMPPTNNPDGESGTPNPGEQADRTKAENDNDTEKKEQTPEEKNKLETLIEEVRSKAEKSISKKFEKTLQEKDAEIAKRDKIIGELTFKEKLAVINEHLPDEIFGNKEEDKKKAAEEREFYTNLAKEKGLTTEQLTRMLTRAMPIVTKNLNVGFGSSSSKKGQANSADATPDQIKAGIREFTLSDKTTKTFVEDSKTSADDSRKIKEGVKNFLAGR